MACNAGSNAISSNSSSIIIDQININSIKNKKHEIGLLIDRRKNVTNHFICINDTRLKRNQSIRFKGYKCIRKDHHSGTAVPGGVLILVKNGIKISEIENNINELIVIEAETDNKRLRLATVYLHPGEILLQKHFDALEGSSHNFEAAVLIGDMNAHIGLGHTKKTDKAGQMLTSLACSNGYAIQNDDDPTYFSTSRNITSCIDLCLLKLKTSASSTKWFTDGQCGSDHVITSFKLDIGFKTGKRTIK